MKEIYEDYNLWIPIVNTNNRTVTPYVWDKDAIGVRILSGERKIYFHTTKTAANGGDSALRIKGSGRKYDLCKLKFFIDIDKDGSSNEEISNKDGVMFAIVNKGSIIIDDDTPVFNGQDLVKAITNKVYGGKPFTQVYDILPIQIKVRKLRDVTII